MATPLRSTKQKDVREVTDVRCKWDSLLQEYNLNNFFPGKLSLQMARSLHEQRNLDKSNLAQSTLEQIMLMNSQCREQVIEKYSQGIGEDMARTYGQTKAKPSRVEAKRATFSHPMDMMLLLFTCSNFMLRQVLAQKLFTCRLAIPFIVPTYEGKIEMFIWPLRSIVMNLKTQTGITEEALVKSKINMVSFVQYVKSNISKSKMINNLLYSGQDVFFHEDVACGRTQRLVSNGTIEMSHVFPNGLEDDQFSEPALIFNLRGDACTYPQQHRIAMDLAADTVLVIIVDIGELHSEPVQKMLQDSTKQMQTRAIIILTDSKKHDKDNINKLHTTLLGLVDTDDIKVIRTFEMEGMGDRNVTKVNEDIQNAIKKKMSSNPKWSIEDVSSSNER